MGALLTLAWIVAVVYASIPCYWFLIHPFADFWRRLGISYEGGPGERQRRIRFPNGFGALFMGVKWEGKGS